MDLTREEWLQTCSDIIVTEIIAKTWKIRTKFKTKIRDWPCRPDNKKIGICHASSDSKQGYNEIFINASVSDPLQVLAGLTHELIHAVDDCRTGHQYDFEIIALRVGFQGVLRKPEMNKELIKRLKEIIKKVGPLPEGELKPKTLKGGANRNILVNCPGCEFKFNTSRKQIRNVIDLKARIACPGCDFSMRWEN